MIFRSKKLFAFNYELVIINKFVQLRLIMFDQDKKHLKNSLGLRVTIF